MTPCFAATLFFSIPQDYDGGELVVEDTYGIRSVKLPPGHLVLYSSSSLHNVRPIIRSVRVSSFSWILSTIRDGARTLRVDLDNVAQRIAAEEIDSPNAIRLTGIYHNLLCRLGRGVDFSRSFSHSLSDVLLRTAAQRPKRRMAVASALTGVLLLDIVDAYDA